MPPTVREVLGPELSCQLPSQVELECRRGSAASSAVAAPRLAGFKLRRRHSGTQLQVDLDSDLRRPATAHWHLRGLPVHFKFAATVTGYVTGNFAGASAPRRLRLNLKATVYDSKHLPDSDSDSDSDSPSRDAH